MTDPNTCPKCEIVLPADAPEGICPRCLMLAGLEDAVSPALAVTTPQPGGFTPTPPAEIAEFFPHLEITGVLGVGGMGTVYRARQTKLDRAVALKIIRPESAEDAAFAERFNREARTLARLSHPNIVGIHDFGEVSTDEANSKLYYFVMEFVDGPNLREVVLNGEIEPQHALAIVPQICEALQYAHGEGVVHRDIKPENILVDSRGRVKIADFGLAKLAERSVDSFTLTGTHQVMGTPRYMAPEQMEGSREVDHRADIYSLGVVFYELLTGELPMGQFEPPSAKVAVDPRVDEIVLRALAREPERRYQTASELKLEVEDLSRISPPDRFPAGDQQDADYRVGASTIIEREAIAAWRWLAADTQPGRKSPRPELPALLMILLSLAACLIVLLPWIDVQLLNSAALQAEASDSIVNTLESSPTHALCVTQVEAVPSSRTGDVITESQHTFSGVDKWPGITFCACFSLLTLLLIALPGAKRRLAPWLLLMSVLAALGLVHVFLFQVEIENSQFLPLSDESDLSAAALGVSPLILVQDSSGYEESQTLSRLKHRMTFRTAYYSAMGISIALLVLSATGIRHALSQDSRAEKSRSHSSSQPLARHRFVSPVRSDLSQQIQFHFTAIGYQLVNQTVDAWVFHRGQAAAGLASMEASSFATTLTIRSVTDSPATVAVSCLWEVGTAGALMFGREVSRLEEEGRELERILNRSDSHPESISPSVPDAMAETSAVPVHSFGAAALTPGLPMDVSPSEGVDEIQAVLDGPAIAMMVIGLLSAIGCFVTFAMQFESRMTRDAALFFIPGCVFGVIMFVGGTLMKRMRSPGLSMTAGIVGLIPVSPSFLITMPIGIWAINVLKRADVQKAFIHQARQRRLATEQDRSPRFSRKAILGACLIPFALFGLGGMLIATSVEVSRGNSSAPSPQILTALALLPALLSPFLTTILGFVAVTQIRHSEGRLTGLGLAFVDAALFPSLMIDTALLSGVNYFLHSSGAHQNGFNVIMFGSLAIVVILNLLVLRFAWRKAVQPVVTGHPG